MSYEHQQHQPSSPSAYDDGTPPGGMENEFYIDGTLYVDGVPVSRAEQQGRLARRNQLQENPCAKFLRLVRSHLLI